MKFEEVEEKVEELVEANHWRQALELCRSVDSNHRYNSARTLIYAIIPESGYLSRSAKIWIDPLFPEFLLSFAHGDPVLASQTIILWVAKCLENAYREVNHIDPLFDEVIAVLRGCAPILDAKQMEMGGAVLMPLHEIIESHQTTTPNQYEHEVWVRVDIHTNLTIDQRRLLQDEFEQLKIPTELLYRIWHTYRLEEKQGHRNIERYDALFSSWLAILTLFGQGWEQVMSIAHCAASLSIHANYQDQNKPQSNRRRSIYKSTGFGLEIMDSPGVSYSLEQDACNDLIEAYLEIFTQAQSS